MKAEHTYKDYDFTSGLASDIRALIAEKRACLDSHCNGIARYLHELDKFLSGTEYDCKVLTREAAEAFMADIESRSLKPGSVKHYITSMRMLGIYQRLQGKEAYIWQKTIHGVQSSYRRPYIASDEELKQFSEYLNRHLMSVPLQRRQLDLCYAVMFRLYLCCGLRNSEATDLLREEVRFSDQTFYIRHSKGDKDRIVPFSDEIAALLKCCDEFLEERFTNRQYFFVNTSGNRICGENVSEWLKHHWTCCFGSTSKDLRPTVQDLRHTFVVRCVDSWGCEERADFAVKFPLLSKYVGHASVQNTLYYYHQFRGVSQLAENWIMSSDEVALEVQDAIF